MNVNLLTSPIAIVEMIRNAVIGGLTCTANRHLLETSGFKPVDFLKRRIEQGHESVIEHINLTFEIQGISRALLQELARHRHVSLSVESTRWTLKKWAGMTYEEYTAWENGPFREAVTHILSRGLANDFNELFYGSLISYARDMFRTIRDRLNNSDELPDVMKYFLPELYPTNLVMTCNLRELRHIYSLRAKPPALQEFQDLCAAIKATLPEDVKTLLELKND